MKKINKLITVILCVSCFISAMLITGCGGSSSKYTSLEEALVSSFKNYDKKKDEEKEEIIEQLKEYALNDLNGTLYYHDDRRTQGSDYMMKQNPKGFTDERDVRTFFVVSKDEIYALPFDENEIEQKGITIDNVSSVENVEQYKFSLSDIEIKHDQQIYVKYTLLNSYYENMPEVHEDYKTLTIYYYAQSDKSYYMRGFFVDLVHDRDLTKKPEGLAGVQYSREYFRDAQSADDYSNHQIASSEAFKEKLDREAAEYVQSLRDEEELKKSNPAIGMTKSQVEKCAWGKPDRKNISEYSWGIEEQWVYDGKGYVYFENGVVTAIQHN